MEANVTSAERPPRLPRPPEKIAIVSFVLVFLCGVVLGAVVMSFSGHANLHGTSPLAAGLGTPVSIREWKEQLDLTDQQTVQLNSVLDDVFRYYDNVLADGNSRIMEILNPEQQRKYRELIAAHRK